MSTSVSKNVSMSWVDAWVEAMDLDLHAKPKISVARWSASPLKGRNTLLHEEKKEMDENRSIGTVADGSAFAKTEMATCKW